MPLHQRGQHRGSQDHGYPAPGCLHEFRVVLRDGGVRGDHDRRTAGQQVERAGVVADADVRAAGAQREDAAALLGVRSGHLPTPGQQDPRDSGHSGAADPDHVDTFQLRGQVGHRVPLVSAATSSTMRATSVAALR